MRICTLCLVRQENKILLGYKKRGFGIGRWNGFGGKVGEYETIEQAAVRELQEEAGLNANEVTKTGILTFEFENGQESLEVHVYNVLRFSGEPAESEEMRPQWFLVNEIPLANMWPDDKYWLPLFFEGKKFVGNFKFKDLDILLKNELIEVENL